MTVQDLTYEELLMEYASVKRDEKDIYKKKKDLETEIDRRYKAAMEKFKNGRD